MAKLRVAYGPKNVAISSIRKGEIPRGTLVLTRDTAEILFYDHEGNLKKYKEKYRFTSKEDAEKWLLTHNCRGQIFSVHEEDDFNAYIIDKDNKLKVLSSGSVIENVQADYLVEDPEDPAFIKNKPTSFPMKMIDGLLSALDSKVDIVNDIQPGVLMVASAEGEGNLECSGVKLDDLLDTVSRKVEISNEVKPGVLMISDESGNLRCSGVLPSDLLRVSDIKLGSITSTKMIDIAGEYIIPIPEEVVEYTNLNVYHNGSLLAEGIHYIVSGPNIILKSYTTYEGDIFSFVASGVTTSLPGSGSDHYHGNLPVLQNITQEKIDLWDSAIRVFRMNGVTLPVVNGILNFSLKPKDIGAASESHTHGNYLSKESIFDSEGKILESLLPRTSNSAIESIMLGDSLLPVIDKIVVIPVATKDQLGVVRSSDGPNKVFVDPIDGTMSIKKIDFSTLEQPEGQELVLVGGDATSSLSF